MTTAFQQESGSIGQNKTTEPKFKNYRNFYILSIQTGLFFIQMQYHIM